MVEYHLSMHVQETLINSVVTDKKVMKAESDFFGRRMVIVEEERCVREGNGSEKTKIHSKMHKTVKIAKNTEQRNNTRSCKRKMSTNLQR